MDINWTINSQIVYRRKTQMTLLIPHQISNTLSGRLYNMQLIDNYYNKSITIERPFIRQLPNGQVELSWTAI
jgi:hypothetical protein